MQETAEIRERLFALRDEKNAVFAAKLIPNLPDESILGARTPALRKLAKELAREGKGTRFMEQLPHAYFEENSLHAFLLGEIRDFSVCMEQTERFLPFVDNWATCDGMNPPVFRKHRAKLLDHVRRWLRADGTYTVRFAVGMLMAHFLDEDFDPEFLQMVSVIESDEYYVNMMRAWYFATALAKQWESALPYLEDARLDRWTHNKTIQKARESFRITPAQKMYLITLKK